MARWQEIGAGCHLGCQITLQLCMCVATVCGGIRHHFKTVTVQLGEPRERRAASLYKTGVLSLSEHPTPMTPETSVE